MVVIVACCLVGGLAGWAAALFSRDSAAARVGAKVTLGISGALLVGGLLWLVGLDFGGGLLGVLLAAATGATCGLLAGRLLPGA